MYKYIYIYVYIYIYIHIYIHTYINLGTKLIWIAGIESFCHVLSWAQLWLTVWLKLSRASYHPCEATMEAICIDFGYFLNRRWPAFIFISAPVAI